ncbi:MAG: hypothetical protein FWF07_00550 [Methanomassiliicoccaceae archaeon]|nr:hypothetical protein [Methanomassiliicoccaceae archaeon]
MDYSFDKAKLKKELYDVAENYDSACFVHVLLEMIEEHVAAFSEMVKEEQR